MSQLEQKNKRLWKYKLMGPKLSIILGSVGYVPETYHNIKVLFNLLELEKLNFELSQITNL